MDIGARTIYLYKDWLSIYIYIGHAITIRHDIDISTFNRKTFSSAHQMINCFWDFIDNLSNYHHKWISGSPNLETSSFPALCEPIRAIEICHDQCNLQLRSGPTGRIHFGDELTEQECTPWYVIRRFSFPPQIRSHCSQLRGPACNTQRIS